MFADAADARPQGSQWLFDFYRRCTFNPNTRSVGRCAMTVQPPARLKWLVRRKSFSLALVTVLDVAGILITIEFGKFLGFNFHTGILYPIVAAILAVGLALGFLIESGGLRVDWRLIDNTRNELIALVIISIIPRLIFALIANPLPDEYAILLVLQSRPLENLWRFLIDYGSYVGYLKVHPPLGFLIMSVFYTLVPTPFGARIPSILMSTGMAVTVYFVIRENFNEKAFLPALLFALFPQTVLFLSLAVTDVYLQFFGLLAIWLFLRANKTGSAKTSAFAGIFLGLAFWSKEMLWLFWALLILLTAILLPARLAKVKKLTSIAVTYVVAAIVIAVWYFINPAVFMEVGQKSTASLWSSLLNLLNHNLISQSLPASSADCNSVLWLCRIFPAISPAGRGYISYPELLAQIPLWVTPIAVPLAGFAILHSFTHRDRHGMFTLLWLAIPLIAMIPGRSSIRYLILFTLPFALYAAYGTRALDRGWKLRTLILATLVISLSITAVIAEQQYYGPGEAAIELRQLGLDKGRILTNWLAIEYYLPNAQIFSVNAHNASQTRTLLGTEKIDAVVIFNNARSSSTPDPVSNAVRTVIESSYTSRIEAGPSNFAWYEILFNAAQDKGLPPAFHLRIKQFSASWFNRLNFKLFSNSALLPSESSNASLDNMFKTPAWARQLALGNFLVYHKRNLTFLRSDRRIAPITLFLSGVNFREPNRKVATFEMQRCSIRVFSL